MRAKKLDYSRFEGKKFNNVTVIDFSHKIGKKSYMNAVCDCGKHFKIRTDAIGITKSCGCGIGGGQKTKIDFDLILGQKKNYLTAIKKIEGDGEGSMLLCKCDCGRDLSIRPFAFGKVKTCGYCGLNGRRNRPIDYSEIIGTRFNYFVVIKYIGVEGKRTYLQCKCDCGKEFKMRADNLYCQVSCGCVMVRKSGISHPSYMDGRTKERLYTTYQQIKSRTSKEWCKEYKYYGARGIKMCEDWKQGYHVFKKWALENGYQEHLTIDRINNDGDYEPDNCRWVTQKVQCGNKRNNIYIEMNGEKMCLSAWCEKLGLNYNNMYDKGRRRFKKTGKWELVL